MPLEPILSTTGASDPIDALFILEEKLAG